ncbi:MAG: phosphotransferase family protein [Acidimicrobiales bacterium]
MGERPALDLDDVARRATAAAAEVWPGASVDGVHMMMGGHSGLTLAGTLHGAGERREIVMKVAPPGRTPVGRHDVMRQARLLQGLGTVEGVAVPDVYFTDDDPPPLFAMSFATGEATEPVLSANALDPAVTRARTFAAVELMAALHGAVPGQIGLDDEPVVSIVEEMQKWEKTMHAVPPELRPRGPELLARLRAEVPDDVEPSVVHGDYRLGNILIDGVTPTAIIDWEIWSIGDPRGDLAWFCVFTEQGDLPGASYDAPGMPSADEVVAAYEAASGGPVRDWVWFQAFGRFKMAAIMGHNLRRHREGRHHDPYQETLVPAILALAERGIELLD